MPGAVVGGMGRSDGSVLLGRYRTVVTRDSLIVRTHSSNNRLPSVPISPETLLAALDAASAL